MKRDASYETLMGTDNHVAIKQIGKDIEYIKQRVSACEHVFVRPLMQVLAIAVRPVKCFCRKLRSIGDALDKYER